MVLNSFFSPGPIPSTDFSSRPSYGLQPARRRAFVCRSSGRLYINTYPSATAALRSLAASFTSFGCGSAMSAVCAIACHRPSIHHLRPSATVAAWHTCPAAPFRRKASIPPGVVIHAKRAWSFLFLFLLSSVYSKENLSDFSNETQ